MNVRYDRSHHHMNGNDSHKSLSLFHMMSEVESLDQIMACHWPFNRDQLVCPSRFPFSHVGENDDSLFRSVSIH